MKEVKKMGFSRIDAAELVKVQKSGGSGRSRVDLGPFRDFLGDLAVGEAGEYDLEENEKKSTIMNTIKKVIAEFDHAVSFVRTKGSKLRFIVINVEDAPAKRTRKTKAQKAAELEASAVAA